MRLTFPSGLATAALLAALLAAPHLARAAGAQSDHYSPLVLMLPASARAMALGDAYVAARDNDAALFYNPAQLAIARGMSASVARYRSASTLSSLSGSMAFGPGPGGVGFGVQMLDYGAYSGRFPALARDLTSRGPLPASSLAATLGFATIYRDIRVGFAGKYVEERLPSARTGVLAFDVGLAKDIGQVNVGVSAQNLGEDLVIGQKHAKLPQRYTFGIGGVGLPIGPFDIAASTSVSVLRDGFVTPAGGVELLYSWLDGYTIAGRLGVRRTEDVVQSPITFGGGITVDRVSFDYAFDNFDGPGGAHRFGLRIR
ncbi:MAG: hypothetical protein M3081_21950 [Gemmatimonadota bacterium]|nr:hypothetical protein [Gemmatimonadota bacterium]